MASSEVTGLIYRLRKFVLLIGFSVHKWAIKVGIIEMIRYTVNLCLDAINLEPGFQVFVLVPRMYIVSTGIRDHLVGLC